MTREETIKILNDEEIASLVGKFHGGKEALDLAISAFRPVSREQVEKVWRGEWRLDEEESKKHVEPIYVCTRCENFEAWGNTEKTNFCGYCGAPMTDEAVDIIMRRLETLYETT